MDLFQVNFFELTFYENNGGVDKKSDFFLVTPYFWDTFVFYYLK